jgi:hypothetical protein
MKDFLTAQEVRILQEAHHSSRFRKSGDRIKTILFEIKDYHVGKPQNFLCLMKQQSGDIKRL